MLIQHLQTGQVSPFDGEPTPREIHQLYLGGLRVEREAYSGQLSDLYRANGRHAVVSMGACGVSEFLETYSCLIRSGAVLGPDVIDGQFCAGSLAFWVQAK